MGTWGWRVGVLLLIGGAWDLATRFEIINPFWVSSPGRIVTDIVRQFLATLPANYPERLRNITLQSADELFRAEAALKR